LLFDPDLDLMERLLPHPPREPGYRRGRPHRAFLGRIGLPPDGDPGAFARRLERTLSSSLPRL
ncbi:MAG: lipoate--protein ligase family protein, partial [bacterium]|nr:lipoate--protein ligase family protein [bacterium]